MELDHQKREENASRYETGMKELLFSLSEEVLKGILSATTNSLVRYGSVPVDANGIPKIDAKSHAINSILMYNDAISLLNKQRMKKSYIADYLNQKGVKMTMPASKHTLCSDILSFWGQEMPRDFRLIDDEVPKPKGIGHNGNQSNVQNAVANTLEVVAGPSHSSSANVTVQNNQSHALRQEQGIENQQNGDNNCVAVQQQPDESALSLRQREALLGQQLGKEFSAWFYNRLNTLTDFSVTHFWPECNFRLEIIFASQLNQTFIDEVENNGEVSCAKLKDLVTVKNLYFFPNEESGVRGYLNPHGLAQVMVCGTVHQKENASPLGVFEQIFGLMRDPTLGSNFRIKYSVLRLREGNHLAIQSCQPEMVDSSLVGIIEEVDD